MRLFGGEGGAKDAAAPVETRRGVGASEGVGVCAETHTAGGGLFVLADPPGRFPLNHSRFLSLMEDPSLLETGEGGEGADVRAVQVDSTFRECVNLGGKAMTVELSTYEISPG